jgi:hypothetical protein
MGTQQRRDLQANIPALRKIDTMLTVRIKQLPSLKISNKQKKGAYSLGFTGLNEQDYLDNFKDRTEFWYVKRDSCSETDKEESQQSDEKWWIPIVKVPPNGLSPASRGWIQHQKELVSQVLKAAMAINANCLMEMSIPETYLEALPKVITASSYSLIIRDKPPCISFLGCSL